MAHSPSDWRCELGYNVSRYTTEWKDVPWRHVATALVQIHCSKEVTRDVRWNREYYSAIDCGLREGQAYKAVLFESYRHLKDVNVRTKRSRVRMYLTEERYYELSLERMKYLCSYLLSWDDNVSRL